MDVNRPQLCSIFILVNLKGTVSREAKFQKEHSHLTCACVAGTCKKRAKEKTGSVRETTVYSSRSFLHLSVFQAPATQAS